MTPKEKAKEFVRIYKNQLYNSYQAKQCALIAVDYIMKAIDYEPPRHDFEIGYWQEVRNEIEKL